MNVAHTTIQNSPPPRRVLLSLENNHSRVPSGSLIISDVFSAGEPESHGVSVAKAAWSLGFSGPIFYQQAISEPLPPLQQHNLAANLLSTPGLDTSLLNKALKDYVVGPPLHMLLSAIDEVERASESQAANCVLNLSSGMCKAQLAHSLYSSASRAWNSSDPQVAQEGEATLDNLSRLFSLNYSALISADPEIAAKERHHLQQTLIDKVGEIWDAEPRIPSERERFIASVQAFETKNSSVVIAAGNEGLLRPAMELETGLQLNTPEDFEQNVLENDSVTSVGASIILDANEAAARYSSNYAGIDFYISGDTNPGLEFDHTQGLSRSGTSLAAPRVSALMSTLHHAFPSATSEQIQQLVQTQLTDPSERLISTRVAREFLLTDSQRP